MSKYTSVGLKFNIIFGIFALMVALAELLVYYLALSNWFSYGLFLLASLLLFLALKKLLTPAIQTNLLIRSNESTEPHSSRSDVVYSQDIRLLLTQSDIYDALKSYIHILESLRYITSVSIRLTETQYFSDQTFGYYQSAFSDLFPQSIQILDFEEKTLYIYPLKLNGSICGHIFIIFESLDLDSSLILNHLDNLSFFLNYVLENHKTINQYRISQSYYEKLFTQNHYPILLINPEDGQIVDCNHAASRLYGYSKEEFLNTNITLINMSSNTYVKSKMNEASLNTTIQFNFKHRTKSGDVIDVNVSSGKILIDDRLLLFSIIRDISDERKMMMDLQKYKNVLDQSPNSVILTNLHGDIEYVNPTFTHVTGYTLEEVYGKNPRLLKSGLQSDEMYKDLWQEISKGHIWEGELINKKKDGSLYYEYAIMTMIKDLENIPLGYLSIKTNISVHKEMTLTMIERIRTLLEKLSQNGQANTRSIPVAFDIHSSKGDPIHD